VSALANTSSTAASVARAAGRAPSATGGARDVPPVSLTMPMPPSVNNAFKTVRRKRRNESGQVTEVLARALTEAAQTWKDEALWRIRIQRPPLVTGPVVIVWGFERAATMLSADASNRIKLAEDALVSAGVIEDDRFVVGGAFSWLPPSSGLCHCLVIPARSITLTFQPAHECAAGGWILPAHHPDMEDDDGDQPRVA
jgi:Holliday junction resolvase RusA-like endonuclease